MTATERREYARAAAGTRRDVHGVLLLDKSPGLTSNRALQAVKRLFRARKAGHTGSLDPLASGLLPVCFGEATKISSFLLEADKLYAVSCRLGVRTATGDAEGEVVELRPVPPLTAAGIERALAGLRGEINQIPPMYSALHHRGQRLYDLAREGIEVPRAPRRVIIHELGLRSWTADTLCLQVRCSKGTYIRTLVEDLAAALGTVAHVSALRRLAVGAYGIEIAMHTLAALEECAARDPQALDRLLLAPDSALRDWPAVHPSGGHAAWYFSRGQAVRMADSPAAGWVRVYDGERFLGLGEVLADGRVAPRRLLHAGQERSSG